MPAVAYECSCQPCRSISIMAPPTESWWPTRTHFHSFNPVTSATFSEDLMHYPKVKLAEEKILKNLKKNKKIEANSWLLNELDGDVDFFRHTDAHDAPHDTFFAVNVD